MFYLRHLKVPVVYTIGGKDPWTALCQDKAEWIQDEDYFFDPDRYHCPDRDNPVLRKNVLTRMISYLN